MDGKVQVSGQTAVMAVNEKLLHALMEKNQELSFALQESVPLRSIYSDALPLGPLMELNARDDQNPFTAERAQGSLNYWRDMAQSILSDPDALGSPTALKSYSHDAVSAANLLAAHDFVSQAEQAYRIATTVWPGNPEAVSGLSDVLAATGRRDEAEQLLDEFTRRFPEEQKTLERLRAGSLATAQRTDQ
jgi:hypothetical protein